MDERRLALIRSGTVRQRHSTGSGYLIAPRLVLTACHVLADKNTGSHWPEIHVWVGHPRVGGVVSTRAEVLWTHPQGLDVALLRLHDEVDVMGSVRWGRPVGKAPLRYEGLGFPLASAGEDRGAEHLRGELAPLSTGSRGLYVLDQKPAPDPRDDGRKPWGGSSGAAVFCEDHIVAVVVQDCQSYGNRRLLACPAGAFTQDSGFDSILRQYTDGPPRLAEIGAPLPKAPPAAERTQTEKNIEQSLWPILGAPGACSAHARALADQLGMRVPADYAPSLPDLVALVTAHPRALASLSGTLAATISDEGDRTRLTSLLSHARASGFGSLLSLEEHECLVDLLRGICKEHPTLLPRAAREALRYACLPEPLSRTHLPVDDLEQVVDELEAMADSEHVPDGTSPVPALLRLTEYVAVAVAGEGSSVLRDWSTRVADRIGIHPTALNERRTDARQWVARQTSPVARVVLDLAADHDAPDERYVCRVLLARQDGTHTVLREPETVSKTPEEAARHLREAVECAADEPGQEHHVPWVTVLVDRQGLHLAVDEWNPGAPNEFVPEQPLGVEFRLTLSCPEMSYFARGRDREQRRRWASGDQVPLVADRNCDSPRRLTRLLQNSHRDSARVILHGPRDQRTQLLQACLALGVPVVLWDREANCYEDATRLQRLDPTGPLADLPERVRRVRGEVFDSEEAALPRPALVWEEGHHPEPRSLQLRDPRKGTHAS
ncbi:trypsin-like peptidase domain-containing protein [Streptomyces sp. NPDC048171]|uniref:VMAP-C domain-containing protein n=1 Tax=Streptomyces sp. NPDC048171 TaxID=3365504 RepID=UPI00371988EF